MSSPRSSEIRPAYGHKLVLDGFIQRLLGAITRSPLLRVRASKTGRLFDSSRLEHVTPGLANELLEGIIDGAEPVALQFDMRALKEGKSKGSDQLFGANTSLDAEVARSQLHCITAEHRTGTRF